MELRGEHPLLRTCRPAYPEDAIHGRRGHLAAAVAAAIALSLSACGGSYEKVIAHLTVDKAGKRGDEARFDKDNVDVYGLGLNGGGDSSGQTEWSYLTNTTGWSHTDKNPWGTHYNYDDPLRPHGPRRRFRRFNAAARCGGAGC